MATGGSRSGTPPSSAGRMIPVCPSAATQATAGMPSLRATVADSRDMTCLPGTTSRAGTPRRMTLRTRRTPPARCLAGPASAARPASTFTVRPSSLKRTTAMPAAMTPAPMMPATWTRMRDIPSRDTRTPQTAPPDTVRPRTLATATGPRRPMKRPVPMRPLGPLNRTAATPAGRGPTSPAATKVTRPAVTTPAAPRAMPATSRPCSRPVSVRSAMGATRPPPTRSRAIRTPAPVSAATSPRRPASRTRAGQAMASRLWPAGL